MFGRRKPEEFTFVHVPSSIAATASDVIGAHGNFKKWNREAVSQSIETDAPVHLFVPLGSRAVERYLALENLFGTFAEAGPSSMKDTSDALSLVLSAVQRTMYSPASTGETADFQRAQDAA
jgi:hypothetical protein